MKVYKEIDMDDFEAWSGGVDTLERIKETGKIRELESLLEELEPEEGWTETAINDILWFDDEWLFKELGISWDDDEEEDDEEEDDEEEDDEEEDDEGEDDEEEDDETPPEPSDPEPLAEFHILKEIEKSMEKEI